MNVVQSAMVNGSREQTGLWEVVGEIASACSVGTNDAFALLKREVDFLISRTDIYLVRSEKLYSSADCRVVDKQELELLPYSAIEFHSNGPFYYLSNEPRV